MPINITGQTSSQYTNVSNENNNTKTSINNKQEPIYTNNVTLSENSRFLSRLEQHIESLPVIDENRVHEIKEKIKHNDYDTNYLFLAEKIIKIEYEIH